MEQAFKMDPSDLKGLGFWFWYRDGWCGCADVVHMIFGHSNETLTEAVLWIISIVCIPFLYLIFPVYCGLVSERNAINLAERGKYVTMSGRKGIDYCKLMNKLRGNNEQK